MTAIDSGYAHDPRRWRAGRHILFGTVVIAALFGGLGYWSMNTEIEGAVVAPGELRVESKQKPVQHPEGGVVGEIFVREGAAVKAGDRLIRLDQTTQEATMAILDVQLDEFTARLARLVAERDGAERVSFPRALLDKAVTDAELSRNISDQRRLFESRLAGYRQQRAQLGERIGQLENEIAGSGSRLSAYRGQLRSVEEELRVQRQLLAQGLTTRTRAQEFVREKVRIDGEIGALQSEVARLRRQIQETRLEITRLQETRRSESLSELREVKTRIDELKQRRIVANDALTKIELRAPQDGIVQDMSVYAAGAVVAPGAPIMVIVPVDDRLVLEARVDATKRDQIAIGRPARVRFSAFNQRTTPELNGEVVKISADRKEDEVTGARYFAVEILVPEDERARLGEENELVPGLPAEIFITTDKRTPLSYLLKPLSDSFEKAFREE